MSTMGLDFDPDKPVTIPLLTSMYWRLDIMQYVAVRRSFQRMGTVGLW